MEIAIGREVMCSTKSIAIGGSNTAACCKTAGVAVGDVSVESGFAFRGYSARTCQAVLISANG